MIRPLFKKGEVDRDIVAAGRDLLGNIIAPPIRPMLKWAEDEIILPPRGKYKNRRYRGSRFPAAVIWFDYLDRGEFMIHIATGPSQSGKTLQCFIIPVLYCLFEKNEDVIVGLPSMDMANDKWKKDLKPMIERTRYKGLLPSKGEGSRGGKVRVLEFEHGPTLTFMSFGGDDKSKAGETAKNLIITETDGGGDPQETSEEAGPIEQLIARTMSHDLDAFIVMECTVSTTKGETWTRYSLGTASELVRPCPHCGEYVKPERMHFRGWENHDNEIDAGANASFHCPKCSESWTDEQRFYANRKTKLIHRGQEINCAGEISGPVPKTRTFGFRWSAVDNMFRSSALLGSLEWNAQRSKKPEEAQKALDQFQYATPWEDPEQDENEFDPHEAAGRIGKPPIQALPSGFDRGTPRSVVPLGTDVLTVGVDLRARQLHYVVLASQFDATCRIIQYATLNVLSNKLGVERGIRSALTYLRDQVLAPGFRGEDDRVWFPDSVWVDAGWKGRYVYNFVNQTQQMDNWADVFMPYVGRGTGKQYTHAWTPQTKVGRNVPYIGDEFYFTWVRSTTPHTRLAVVNADEWKTFVHYRLKQPTHRTTEQGDDGNARELPPEQWELLPGAMSFFIPDAADHNEITRHFAAENPVRIWIPDKGETVIWRTISRVNHYFDATYAACAAARHNDVVILETPEPAVAGGYQEESFNGIQTPDGRNFHEGI